MCKKIILCDDEFGGKSKQEAKKLKELSSKQTFSIRKPYGRVHEELNRYAVLCGTSNDEEVINDPTGNRRILPIVISEIDWDAYAAIDKTDLFIEALHSYKLNGTDSWQLSKAEITMLNEKTLNNIQPAVEKELLYNYFTIPDEKNDGIGAEWLTNSEIKNIIESYTEQKINQNKLGAILKSIGCKKVSRSERDNRGCYLLIPKTNSSNYQQRLGNQDKPF
jgi:predicted P-loop ATPase